MKEKTSPEKDIGERRAERGAGTPFRSACLAVTVFYLCAGFLNGRHLHEVASRREYGPSRQFWMALTAPMAGLSTSLGGDRFRSLFENVLEKTP